MILTISPLLPGLFLNNNVFPFSFQQSCIQQSCGFLQLSQFWCTLYNNLCFFFDLVLISSDAAVPNTHKVITQCFLWFNILIFPGDFTVPQCFWYILANLILFLFYLVCNSVVDFSLAHCLHQFFNFFVFSM